MNDFDKSVRFDDKEAEETYRGAKCK